MRVLHAGNVDSGYVLAKELRKKGIEADFLTSKQMITGKYLSVNNPFDFDIELKDSYPDWVHFYDVEKKGWKSFVLRTMRKYDFVHAYMELPIFAMFSMKPYLAQSVGDDLRDLAFQKSIKGYLLRVAYRRAKAFIYEWPPHRPFVDKLGLKNAIFVPKPWDATKFIRKKIKKPNNQCLTVFHPLGQDWQTKGNDKFLKAFIRLCKEGKNIFLYYVDWGQDADKARNLLTLPQVKGRIEIIPGPIPREKIIEYMEKSDILADQFNSGSFTRMGIEASIFGMPLLVNLDEDLHLKLYGEIPPTINAKNDEEIYTKLKNLTESKDMLIEIGERAHEWAIKHYDLKKNVDKYIQIYQDILGK